MKKNISVFIANTQKYVEAEGGSTLVEVLGSMEQPLGFCPACALVNNKIEALGFPLFTPKTVEFLPLDSPDGNRTYVRSLCMMLYHAVHSLFPARVCGSSILCPTVISAGSTVRKVRLRCRRRRS